MARGWDRFTFLVADESDLWMFHINPPLEIHPTETVDHIPLPVLGNCIRVAGHGELESCVRDITRPFILVLSYLIVYIFVRRAGGVQFIQRPGQKQRLYTSGEWGGGFGALLDQDASSCQGEGVFL